MNTRLGKKQFFIDGIMLTLVGLAMRGAAMFFGAFVSRAVGAEGVGLYTLVTTVYSFAVTLATSGISLTVTRLVASAIGEGRGGELGRILRASVIYSLLFGALATLILALGADLIGEHILSDERAATPLRFLALSLVPVSLSSALSGYFVGVRRVRFNASAQVIGQVFRIAVTVLLVMLFSRYGITYAVAALALGTTATELLSLVIMLFGFILDRRKTKHREKGGADMRPVFATATPLALSQYVRSVLISFEHILIPKRLTDRGEGRAEAYSHYGSLHGMALPVILYPMSPLSSFSGLLVPEFAGDIAAGNRERMSRIAERAINLTLTYSAVIMTFLSSFSEELGYVIYSSYDAGRYIEMLAPVVPIMYLDHVTDSMLKGIGEQVFSMWVNISDSVLSIILVWVLIPRLGIAGYALVIVIMEGYNFLLSALRLRRHVRVRIRFMHSLILPIAASAFSLHIADSVFRFNGAAASVYWVAMKIVFALSLLTAITALLGITERVKEMRRTAEYSAL